ncbi:hypothetical protein JW707_03385 [Candidatus Woesearchaeota archaeon]|nr:hypothetical protein [Candidatus Woesearchaeota archaeon]
MLEYLIVGQQMQQPYPQQYPQQQYPQQQMQRPAQPMPQAAPSGAVGMGTIVQWAGIAGAASGGVQAVLGIVSGFDIIGFLMTVVIAAVLGILVAILLGQFGAKIPIQGTIMIKAAMFMFVLNLLTGFIFGLGEGALGVIVGIIGVGAGAFLYGWLVQKKIPNLI